MQFKSSVEKDKLSALKLECSGARTEDERQCKIQVHIIFRTEIHGFLVSVLSELDHEVVQEFPAAMVGQLHQIRAKNMLTGIIMQLFSFLLSK